MLKVPLVENDNARKGWKHAHRSKMWQQFGLLSMTSSTKAWFHYFPGLENLNLKFHDFPGSVQTTQKIPGLSRLVTVVGMLSASRGCLCAGETLPLSPLLGSLSVSTGRFVTLTWLSVVTDASVDVGVSTANAPVAVPGTVVRSNSTGLQNNHRNKSQQQKLTTN